MKQIIYTRYNTYREAHLIILTHDGARLVGWEHSQAKTGYIVATEENDET